MSGTGVETPGGAGASGDIPEPPDYLACTGVEAGGAGVAASQLGYRNGVPGMESAGIEMAGGETAYLTLRTGIANWWDWC